MGYDPNMTQYPAEGGTSKQKNKNTTKIIILVVCIVVLVALIVVLAMNYSAITGAESVTDAEGATIRQGRGTTEMSVIDTDGTVRTITTDKSLLTYDAILTEYTDVMNTLKTTAPGFTKTEYQNLPTEYQSLGSLGNLVLPIIEENVTSKSAVTPDTYASSNAQKLPIYDSAYGCLLTDTSKIKNAYCEILEDEENDTEQYKIVITLIDEENPTSLSSGATSTTGTINAIFEPWSAGEMISAVTALTGSTMDFNYTDCTVALIYDYDSRQVESITMTMNIDIVLDTLLGDISARVVDITEFTDFAYPTE